MVCFLSLGYYIPITEHPELIQTLVSRMLCSILVLSLLIVLPEPGLGKQPNILFILADDFGYNDVSWNNQDVFTPNLEKLGREGVILDTY